MTLSGLEHFVRKQERFLCEPNGKEAAKMSSVRTAAERRTSGKTHGTGVSETCLCIDSYNTKRILKTQLMDLVTPACCYDILLHRYNK